MLGYPHVRIRDSENLKALIKHSREIFPHAPSRWVPRTQEGGGLPWTADTCLWSRPSVWSDWTTEHYHTANNINYNPSPVPLSVRLTSWYHQRWGPALTPPQTHPLHRDTVNTFIQLHTCIQWNVAMYTLKGWRGYRLLATGYWLLTTGYWLGVLTVHIGSSSVRTQHTLELLLRVCRDKMVVVWISVTPTKQLKL